MQNLHQKRQILQKQCRRQMLRQASYQMAQKHSVMPGEPNPILAPTTELDLLTLPAEPYFHHHHHLDDGMRSMPTPLSPIEDTSNNYDSVDQEESMDTTQ